MLMLMVSSSVRTRLKLLSSGPFCSFCHHKTNKGTKQRSSLAGFTVCLHCKLSNICLGTYRRPEFGHKRQFTQLSVDTLNDHRNQQLKSLSFEHLTSFIWSGCVPKPRSISNCYKMPTCSSFVFKRPDKWRGIVSILIKLKAVWANVCTKD